MWLTWGVVGPHVYTHTQSGFVDLNQSRFTLSAPRNSIREVQLFMSETKNLPFFFPELKKYKACICVCRWSALIRRCTTNVRCCVTARPRVRWFVILATMTWTVSTGCLAPQMWSSWSRSHSTRATRSTGVPTWALEMFWKVDHNQTTHTHTHLVSCSYRFFMPIHLKWETIGKTKLTKVESHQSTG